MEILSILNKSGLEPGEVTHACDPSPWELEVGKSGRSWWPVSTTQGPVSKENQGGGELLRFNSHVTNVSIYGVKFYDIDCGDILFVL